ncbi:MAG: prepilin-type N-terminal cleavage/methylation domain-containing protein [Syntrophobacteraceae bacterium]|nr:prepilin-type N-terminal cleavage/methylation domain-containing protein [Syntrophobacteraceae bacterium]
MSGFTLIEVMISLVVGILIVGGVMGLISTSLQYKARIQAMERIQPVLEAAAQEVLADPQKALAGAVRLPWLPGSPEVGVIPARVELPQAGGIARNAGNLYHIRLVYLDQVLEFSVIIPQTEKR